MKKLLLFACLSFSCSNTEQAEDGMDVVYFDTESTDFTVSANDYAGTFFVINKFDEKVNTDWDLSEVIVVENGVESTIKNILMDDLPVNTYKMRMSGGWFSILNGADKLKVNIHKNETGVGRMLTIKIDGFRLSAESLTIRQRAN